MTTRDLTPSAAVGGERWNLGPSDPLTFENYSGSVDDPTPAEWAVEAEKAASDAYAQYMGDPEGRDDTDTARQAAALAIERAALRALQPSSAADAKPVAWLIPGTDHDMVVFKDVADEARSRGFEVRPLYDHAQPHSSQQAGTERVAELEAEVIHLRDVLLGIAESDHYRRYPKQHEDGGCRGQSGLRAVRALTGKHGSYLNDDDVRSNDNNRRIALGLPEVSA